MTMLAMTMLAMWVTLTAAALAEQTPKTKLERPTDWVTRSDSGAQTSAPLYFVSMPPGWHITTGPGTLLYRPEQTCLKSCRIETEIFLFPGKGDGGYGVFFGLEVAGDPTAHYDAFMLRHDGAYARGPRGGAFPWSLDFARYVAQALPDKPVKNIITIDVEDRDDARHATFTVNGHRMLLEHYPHGDTARTPLAGVVGLRVDAGVNLHVTRFDVAAK